MTAVDSQEGVTPAQASQGWRRPRSMRPVILALAVLAVVAVIGLGVRWLSVGRFMEATNDAYLKADAMVVAPRVSGYVAEVLVAANQDVEPGQVLVRIEDGTYRAQLARAQAQLGSATAAIKSLEAQVAHQKSVLEQTAAAATLSGARSDYAEREAGRFGHLAESGAVSRQQVDQSRTMSDQGHAELASAQAAVTSASRAVDVLTAEIGEAESARDAAKAGLLAAQLDVDATELRSRIKGRVGDKTVSIGQFVLAGTRMMSVMPLQDVYLEANFKETQLARLHIGQPVQIRVDALPDTVVAGRVESWSPGTGAQFALMPPENATGNFTKIVQRVPVRIRIEADPQLRDALLPGLSVTATVDTRDRH